MKDLTISDLENAPCGFLIFSDAGLITSINETLLTLLGYNEKVELLGKNIEMLFTIAGRIFYQTHFFPMIRLHGKADEIFFSLRKKYRDELPVMCNALRRERDGNVANHCIFIPVNERSKYEQELLDARRKAERALEENYDLLQAKKELESRTVELDRQLSKLTRVNEDISQFSKVISHDLQESIRKIALFSEIVLKEVKELIPKNRLKDLEKINSECLRLRELASDIDKFMSLSIVTEEIRSINLEHVLPCEFERIHDGGKNTSFTIDTLPIIEGFEKQLMLLFGNIFRYYIETKDEETVQTISVECSIVQQNSFRAIKGKYKYINFAKFVISDNLDGHKRAEDFMFKLQKKPGAKYINFALPFCKKIVDNHYGDIYFNSKNSSKSEIIILLPLLHQQQIELEPSN